MKKDVQAKDVADEAFLQVVAKKESEQNCWSYFWEVAEALAVPEKVVLAKARALIGRGLMTGCACGCRGDFELTAAGEALLARHSPPR